MVDHCPIRPESSGSLVAAPTDRRQQTTLSLETVQSSVTSSVHSETSWTVSDIAKAGQILMLQSAASAASVASVALPARTALPASTALPTSPASEASPASPDFAASAASATSATSLSSGVQFGSEEEMRRVYSLIYDAFRYRSVLNEALTDTSFYGRFPNHAVHENIVVLLFYDLYKRRFLPRDGRNEVLKEQLFQAAGIPEVDTDLWANRVRLAAALARIRIKNNALQLNKLLPDHLKDDRVLSVDEAFATGWVNSFKSKEPIATLVERSGMKPVAVGQTYLEAENYQLDPICPKFILCHPERRSSLITSSLVEEMTIVLQDRSFCVGPAILDRVLLQHQLTGPVVQTHITTPRSVAYLANILADNDKIEALLAFGAGDKKEEYEAYLTRLGVTNVRVFAERYMDVPADSNILEGVVGVLATPPNTYSGVTNPVDLVCSRGGDMEMLEVLTDVSGSTGSRERVRGILEEQRQTLRHSMSKPQTQVVVYVTHSLLAEENGKMVANLIDEMNRNAWECHAEEQGARPPASSQSKSDVGDAATPVKTPSDPKTASPKRVESREQYRTASASSNVKVPPCDLFEIGEIPNICLNSELKMEEEGCFLALLQRQEITRLDSMYMINIAEQRGLFGDHGGTPAKKARSHKAKRLDMEAARASARAGKDGTTHVSRPRRKVEIERIAAPTMASLQRQEEPDLTGCLKDFDRVVEKDEKEERAKESTSNDGRGTLDEHGGKRRLSNEEKPRREPKGSQRGTKVSLTFEEQADMVRRLSNPTRSSLSRLRTKLLHGGNQNEVQYQIPADIQTKYLGLMNQTDFEGSVPPNTPMAGTTSETEYQETGESDGFDDEYQPFV